MNDVQTTCAEWPSLRTPQCDNNPASPQTIDVATASPSSFLAEPACQDQARYPLAGPKLLAPAPISGQVSVPTDEHSLSHCLMSRRKPAKSQLREDAVPYRTAALADPQKLRFIDLFCGIGGFRIAFERAGCECVWSCDWDKYSQRTYKENFGEQPWGDIHTKAVADIPKHDILCGGFPCQPFSIAGVSKKLSLGRKHGFDDEKQGNLFFEIANIIECHQPAAFVLENVKNLKSHDRGRTFEIIYQTLTEALGYAVYPAIIDAQSVVPQHRERVFLVGFKPWRHFEFPEFPSEGPKLRSILDKDVPAKYTLTDHLWQYLQDYAKKHKAAGNGFGFGLVTPDDIARTLSARYYKDGSEILISQGPGKNPRRLTPRECARLMGYPEDYKITVSDTQAYRQFGNSVVVPVVQRLAKAVVTTLLRPANERPDLVLRDQARHRGFLRNISAQGSFTYITQKRGKI